jgi:hypothetical protein
VKDEEYEKERYGYGGGLRSVIVFFRRHRIRQSYYGDGRHEGKYGVEDYSEH